jgi:flagellar hook-basal body complex protein FliE
MSIDPIGAVGSGFAPLSPVAGLTNAGAAESAGGTGGPDFGALISGGLDHVQALQTKSDNLAIEAATGRLQDVHDYMIAANEAGLAVQLTVALRNRAVEAFNEIMRLQA